MAPPPPLPTIYAQPSTQPGVKLSKLVKKARLLGCQTFSGSVDAIVAKNWINKVSDTIVDMKLEDTFNLVGKSKTSYFCSYCLGVVCTRV